MKSIAFILFATLTFFACRKKENPAPPAPQKTYLVKETWSNGTTRDYKYDNQNRYMGMVYRDGTNYQETITTQFSSNNLPAEAAFRDYTNNRASRYNYTYDAQNRCTKIELRDSVNPTTYTLRLTYDFTYTPTKITRFITVASTGATSRNEMTINGNGNILKEETYKADGAKSFEYTYNAYDDKKNPYSATFTYWSNFIISANNNTAFSGGLVGGTVNTSTATHTYNSDGYPTQTVWNNLFTYTYTYEKR